MKKTNIFTIIGIVVAVVIALAGASYAIYRFVYKKRLQDCGEDFDFECEGCEAEDCSDCPLDHADEDEPEAEKEE